MEDKNLLKISQLAQKANVTPRTIRFYVQEGLISKPVKARKNMALYHPDSIFQIQAIKKAQTDRFMPLVVIRQVLESNGFDYSALESVPVQTTPEATEKKEVCRLDDLPDRVHRDMKKHRWIQTNQGESQAYSGAGADLVRLFRLLNQRGVFWEEFYSALCAIESLVKKTMDLEFRSFTGWALKNSAADFNEIQSLSQTFLDRFMQETRSRHLAEILGRHRKDLDYAFLASADEGFALPAQEIMDQLQAIEKKLVPRTPDVRRLNDLAIGYSCIGDIDTALRLLRRVIRKEPDDLETRVRWIWYRRFSAGSKASSRMKQQMETLVRENPEFAVGRAFLGVWHLFDILEANDPGDILCLTNLCLHELSMADENMPEDLHQQTLIQYAKSRILMDLPHGADHLKKSIVSFENILSQKPRLDTYYAKALPFFPKWLWPNVYYFTGVALQRAGLWEKALEMFEKGRSFNVLPPFHDHIEARISQINQAVDTGGADDGKTVLEPGDGDSFP